MISSASRLGSRSSRILTRAVTRRPVHHVRVSRLASPALNLARNKVPVLFYSTERILQLRSGKRREELPKTMYDAKYETENCGVGLVASLKSIPSRKVVEDADEMLVRMSHRGGCGCDPASGDGAGEPRDGGFFVLFVEVYGLITRTYVCTNVYILVLRVLP